MLRQSVNNNTNRSLFFLRFLGALVIVGLAFAIYGLAIKDNGFIWDDDSMLTGNLAVQAKDGLRYIWASTVLSDYFPLTYTSLWLEWKWWGLNATGYHATNVLFHALACVFFWRALVNFKIPGAWFAAVLFCVHPVNVESVAWIAERKNTLSMLFYMMSLWAFARFQNPNGVPVNLPGAFGVLFLNPTHQPPEKEKPPGGWGFYTLSLLAFICALLSKTAVVMLPVVLLGVSWWLRKHVSRRDVLHTIPFFLLSMVFGGITIWFQYNRAIGEEVIHAHDFWTRLAGAGCAVWYYLFKAILPLRLSFVYPDWEIDSHFFPIYLPAVAVLGVWVLFWRYRSSWGRAPFLAFSYFVISLFPVLGFLQIYFQKYSYVADHWQYFALPAVVTLIAVWEHYISAGQLKERAFSSGALLARGALGSIIVALYAALSWQQTAIYKNNERLWTDTLKKNPDGWLALNNLGLILQDKGQRAEAIEYFQKSLKIKPQQAQARNNLGSAYFADGKLDEAMSCYQEALKVNPKEPVTHYNIASVLDQRGQHPEAIAEYNEALRLKPEYPEAHNNLACLLVVEGKSDEAISHFLEALRSRPDYVDALSNLGSTLMQQNRPADAIVYLTDAVRLSPQHVDAHFNLGNALVTAGRPQDAIEHYQSVLKLRPQMTAAILKMGNALLALGQLDNALKCFTTVLERDPNSAEAHYQSAVIMEFKKDRQEKLQHLREAVRLKPDWLEALNNLSWALATGPNSTFRDGVEAVKFAQRAAEMTGGKNPFILDTLAAAYARTEQFNDALKTAQVARELAMTTGQTNIVQAIQGRIELYQEGKPFHEW